MQINKTQCRSPKCQNTKSEIKEEILQQIYHRNKQHKKYRLMEQNRKTINSQIFGQLIFDKVDKKIQ